SLSWHGVVPRSFRQFRRRHPDAGLELRSLSSLDQVEAVRLGKLDAGYVHRPLIKDRNLAHVPVALHSVMLAVPQGHSLLKVKPLRLRDLRDTAFVWFSKRTNPVFHRQLMQQCNRGGLKHPQIVQEAINEPTILSQVACKLGVAFVSGATCWRRPKASQCDRSLIWIYQYPFRWSGGRTISLHCLRPLWALFNRFPKAQPFPRVELQPSTLLVRIHNQKASALLEQISCTCTVRMAENYEHTDPGSS